MDPAVRIAETAHVSAWAEQAGIRPNGLLRTGLPEGSN